MAKKGEKIIEDRLEKIQCFMELKTQELRVYVISELEALFRQAVLMERTAENREEWMKIWLMRFTRVTRRWRMGSIATDASKRAAEEAARAIHPPKGHVGIYHFIYG